MSTLNDELGFNADKLIDDALTTDDFDYGDSANTSEQNNEQAEVRDENGWPNDRTNDAEVQQPNAGSKDQQQQNAAGQGSEQGALGEGNQPVIPGLKKVGSAYADTKGNIVDAQGRVIAASGAAARLWSKAERLQSSNENLTRQVIAVREQQKQYAGLLQQAQEIATLPQRLGLSKEEYNEGITLLSNFKKQPLEVAKEVVARAMAMGYNATDILGNSASDAIEMRSLAKMIQEIQAPQREARQREETQRQAATVAERNYVDFISKYPDAPVHQDSIAYLMTERGMPAQDAYFAVKQFALDNGLDFSQPLKPQMEAREAAARNQRRSVPSAPRPNGSRANDANFAQNPQLAAPDTDWASLISSAMSDFN